MYAKSCFLMIKFAKSDFYQLVVQLWTAFLRRQLYADVVTRKAVHGLATGSFLKQHFSRLPDVADIEGVRLLIREFKQTFAALLFRLFVHRIGNLERCCSRTFRIREHMELGYIKA